MANKQIKDLIILGDEKSTVFTKTWDDNSRVKKIVIPSGVNKIDTESNFAGLFSVATRAQDKRLLYLSFAPKFFSPII